jgi:outer membrane protein assembly factor BamB
VVVAPVLFHTVGLDAATGAELWRYEAPLDTVDGGPRTPGQLLRVRLDADEQAVYVPAWGGTIAAVELRSGRLRWRWQPEPGIAHRFGAQGVRVSGDTVFGTIWHFLNASGTQAEAWVIALDAATGRQLWRTVLPIGLSGVSVAGRPEVTPEGVVAMTVSADLFSLDRRTGRVMWHVRRQQPGPLDIGHPVFSGPAVVGNTIYADDGFSGLRAVQSGDGKLLWRSSYSGGQFVDDLLVTPTRIYGPSGQLHVFDRRTGAWLGMVGQPGKTGYDSFFPATPAAAEGRVFAPYDGGVLAFREP